MDNAYTKSLTETDRQNTNSECEFSYIWQVTTCFWYHCLEMAVQLILKAY